MIVQQSKLKPQRQKKALQEVLGKLACGMVIVEGKHDVLVLKHLGVEKVFTVNSLLYKRLIATGDKAFVLTDKDRSGQIKKEQVVSALNESYPHLNVDSRVSDYFFRLLNIKCVEEAMVPAKRILEQNLV